MRVRFHQRLYSDGHCRLGRGSIYAYDLELNGVCSILKTMGRLKMLLTRDEK